MKSELITLLLSQFIAYMISNFIIVPIILMKANLS